jgi:hypothetical protein
MFKEMSKYQENQKENAPKKDCFNGDKFNGVYRKTPRPFVLANLENNFYQPIFPKASNYFKENNISWWGGKNPTRHILSSQIACLNHLFAIREDKMAVLAIAQTICNNFTDVLPLDNDANDTKAFISFEVVSDCDHLNECKKEGQKPTRGAHCTSIDALILAKKDNKIFLLPIEWKYTENYDNTDKSMEDGKDHEKGSEKSGKIRLERYSKLIDGSMQLKEQEYFNKENYRNSIYFFEPFYQLMRQTLWAEQMIANKATETIKADDFIHVHVIPKENGNLLNKIYKKSGKDMETTWRDCLVNQEKYKVITPQHLLQNIDNPNLMKYLQTRYWQQ